MFNYLTIFAIIYVLILTVLLIVTMLKIPSNQESQIEFKDSSQNNLPLAKIDGGLDGTEGGNLQFSTKQDTPGSKLTEKFRIGNNGQIGLGGSNYGNSGDVLTSNGSDSPPSWSAPSASGISAYHSVSIDFTFNNNTVTTITSFVNKITPVNIISSASIPFKIPVGGAGVYQISYGFWLGYGAAFSLGQGQCLINGSSGGNQRIFYERNNTVNRDFITASRTFIEPLNDNDEITFYISIYYGSGTYRCIGQCGISKIA